MITSASLQMTTSSLRRAVIGCSLLAALPLAMAQSKPPLKILNCAAGGQRLYPYLAGVKLSIRRRLWPQQQRQKRQRDDGQGQV